jgi:formate dehydrogenase iron-sulfur subunit
MDKCTACTTFGLDRIDNGLTPACVKTCPPKALTYDDRNTQLTAAKARVQYLQSQGFTKANLYGEKELGGLHVMYILADSPEVYGLPKDPKYPAVATAWQDVIKPLGWAAVGLVGAGLILNVMVARAKLLREKEGK